MKNKNISTIKDVLIIIVGTFLYALGFTAFVDPNGFTVGGVTGISALINHMFPKLSIGIIIVIINLPLIYIGFKKFRGEFVAKTAFATLLSSVFIDLCSFVLPTYTGDRVISALAGGVLCGCGMAFVFLRSATTGGVDIIAKIINAKYPFLSVGKVLMAVDGVVILLTALYYKSIETALFSILFIFASSNIIDMLVYGADKGKLIFVVSDFPEVIKSSIVNQMKRGVTEIKSVGGYTGKDKNTLMCAVRNSEIAEIIKIVKSNDSNAFVVLSEAGEILGQGFKNL